MKQLTKGKVNKATSMDLIFISDLFLDYRKTGCSPKDRFLFVAYFLAHFRNPFCESVSIC